MTSDLITADRFIRTWLFGPGADTATHEDMLASGADALIVDLEDFTPPNRRHVARQLLVDLVPRIHAAGQLAAVRINALNGEGRDDLDAALGAGASVISLAMAETATQVAELDEAIAARERSLRCPPGETGILPVCETALGVADVRPIAAASSRIRHALLGAEDLAADLFAERTPGAGELSHARQRFLLDCRAARIEPIDAPYTFSDTEGAAAETRASMALGYRSKSLVRPDQAHALNAALTPDKRELELARRRIAAFERAREQGEDRALVDGHWIEVPTYRSAIRLLERANRMGAG